MRELFWRVVDHIVDDVAARIGQHYFGAIGAFLAPIVVYVVFQALTEVPKRDPAEAEARSAESDTKTIAAETTGRPINGPVARLFERLTVSLLAAIIAGVGWAYLSRDSLAGQRIDASLPV